MDLQFLSICKSLTDESSARQKLEQMPGLIQYSKLKYFSVVMEPFLQGILMSVATNSLSKYLILFERNTYFLHFFIKKLRQKNSIEISSSMGRTLFGVIDTTGILQYGQVFIQYSKNINYKNYCKNNVFNIV